MPTISGTGDPDEVRSLVGLAATTGGVGVVVEVSVAAVVVAAVVIAR